MGRILVSSSVAANEIVGLRNFFFVSGVFKGTELTALLSTYLVEIFLTFEILDSRLNKRDRELKLFVSTIPLIPKK